MCTFFSHFPKVEEKISNMRLDETFRKKREKSKTIIQIEDQSNTSFQQLQSLFFDVLLGGQFSSFVSHIYLLYHHTSFLNSKRHCVIHEYGVTGPSSFIFTNLFKNYESNICSCLQIDKHLFLFM